MADFVGVSDVHFWKVVKDDATAYEAGEVKVLSRTGEVSQTTEQAQAAVYYSNIVAYVVNSRGATTVTAVLEGLKLSVLAELLGVELDPTTGAIYDSGEAKDLSFGISFRADYVGEAGARYYSFPKVSISIPDEATKTKDAGTDTLNQTVTITAATTIHKFEATGKGAKVVICDTENSGELLDLEKFHDAAITPDSLATVCAKAA